MIRTADAIRGIETKQREIPEANRAVTAGRIRANRAARTPFSATRWLRLQAATLE
jgi:hypothetical protein